MAGIKQRSGGRRPGAGSGGARAGAGRPVQRIQLSKEIATELRVLILNLRSSGSQIDENQFVANLIHEKWHEYDNEIQKAVEAMEEFI